jgi:hypothetical protein
VEPPSHGSPVKAEKHANTIRNQRQGHYRPLCTLYIHFTSYDTICVKVRTQQRQVLRHTPFFDGVSSCVLCVFGAVTCASSLLVRVNDNVVNAWLLVHTCLLYFWLVTHRFCWPIKNKKTCFWYLATTVTLDDYGQAGIMLLSVLIGFVYVWTCVHNIYVSYEYLSVCVCVCAWVCTFRHSLFLMACSRVGCVCSERKRVLHHFWYVSMTMLWLHGCFYTHACYICDW